MDQFWYILFAVHVFNPLHVAFDKNSLPCKCVETGFIKNTWQARDKLKSIYVKAYMILLDVRLISRNKLPTMCHYFATCPHKNKPGLIQINLYSLTFIVTVKGLPTLCTAEQLFGCQYDISFDVQQHICICVCLKII